MKTLAHLRRLIAPLLALTCAAAGAWIQLTPWNQATHVLSVGAAEIAPWLVAGALMAILLTLPDVRTRWVPRLTLVLGAGALLLPGSVLLAVPPTRAALDRAFEAGVGMAPAAVSGDVLAPLRPHPFSARDAFRLMAPSSASLRVTRDVPFITHKGVTLTLDVYRPPVDRNGPMVVQFYGGGWRSGSPADNDVIARMLADAGVVVLAVDYRHAPAWIWPAQFDDAQSAVAWAAAHANDYGADPAQLFLVGRSAGAQLALLSGFSAEPGVVRGIVAIYSPVDLVDGYVHPPEPDILDAPALESAFLGGTPETKPSAYRDASPITYAARAHPPVLLINGARDYVILPRLGRLLHEQLRVSGVSVYLEIPWAGHGFDAVPFGPSGQLALYYTERFIAWAARAAR